LLFFSNKTNFILEYRRQVENFSACRIRTLQYEYTIRQLKTQRIMKRLKRAKYLSENIDKYRNELIDQIENVNICSDCSIIDSSVKRQNRSERSKIDLYLCENCSSKRHEDAEKVLKDLENLAIEVEQRLQSIENTERELDQWRDQQLQKNRDFWDGIEFNLLSLN